MGRKPRQRRQDHVDQKEMLSSGFPGIQAGGKAELLGIPGLKYSVEKMKVPVCRFSYHITSILSETPNILTF